MVWVRKGAVIFIFLLAMVLLSSFVLAGPAVRTGSDSYWRTATGNYYVPSGNVGIGTANPNVKLDVNGMVRVTGADVPTSGVGIEQYYSGDTGYIVPYSRSEPAGYRNLSLAGANIFLNSLAGSGNVGIGTRTPSAKLDVNGSININGNITANGIIIGPQMGKTVQFYSTMTASQIQAEINKVGKYIPYGQAVTFQFNDGTYTLDSTLDFSGFFGGGQINIRGNSTEPATKHTNQKVFLDFSQSNGLSIYSNQNYVYVDYLKIRVNTGTAGYSAMVFGKNQYAQAYYNYLMCTTTSSGVGLYAVNGQHGDMYYNYFSACNIAIYSLYESDIFVYDVDDDGTCSSYSLYGNVGTIRYGANNICSTYGTTTSNGGQLLT